MLPRKKKGIASIISGTLAIGVGIAMVILTAMPTWIPLVVQIVGAAASILGFVIVYPDTD